MEATDKAGCHVKSSNLWTNLSLEQDFLEMQRSEDSKSKFFLFYYIGTEYIKYILFFCKMVF